MFTIGQRIRVIRSSLIDRQATGRIVNVLMGMVRVELDAPHDGRSAMWFGDDQVILDTDSCPRCAGDHDRIDRREPCPTVDVTGGPFDPGNRKP